MKNGTKWFAVCSLNMLLLVDVLREFSGFMLVMGRLLNNSAALLFDKVICEEESGVCAVLIFEEYIYQYSVNPHDVVSFCLNKQSVDIS